jgi:hypothetical protein
LRELLSIIGDKHNLTEHQIHDILEWKHKDWTLHAERVTWNLLLLYNEKVSLNDFASVQSHDGPSMTSQNCLVISGLESIIANECVVLNQFWNSEPCVRYRSLEDGQLKDEASVAFKRMETLHLHAAFKVDRSLMKVAHL